VSWHANLVGQIDWPPNPPMQPTPLAASEIVAILRARICYNHIAIYLAARLMGNSLGAYPSHLCQYNAFKP
jgi:hypothetical protein